MDFVEFLQGHKQFVGVRHRHRGNFQVPRLRTSPIVSDR